MNGENNWRVWSRVNMIPMIPIVIFIQVMTIFLVTEFRRAGSMTGRNLLEAVNGFLGWFVANATGPLLFVPSGPILD
jgi:hypothetical protein